VDTTANAIQYVKANEGPAYWEMGASLVTIKASSDDTGGRYALCEVIDEPQSGPPMHRHNNEDESYFIVEGSYEVHFPGASPVALQPGDYARVPQGTVHTYKCVSPTPGRMLVLASPGGLERFFAELGDLAVDRAHPPAPSGPPDFGRMMAVCARHGIDVLGPPA
jgi:mannose-6-phosphate isomerase-like protein (cupin superfamily)